MNRISAHEMGRIDKAVELAQDRMLVITKRKGEQLCCEDPDNIVFDPIPVDKTFDMRNPEHFAKMVNDRMKATCKRCGTKYWTDCEKKTLIVRI